MAEPLRPYPPPPSSLMAVGTFQQIKKKSFKKMLFFLMALQLRKELFLRISSRKKREDIKKIKLISVGNKIIRGIHEKGSEDVVSAVCNTI